MQRHGLGDELLDVDELGYAIGQIDGFPPVDGVLVLAHDVRDDEHGKIERRGSELVFGESPAQFGELHERWLSDRRLLPSAGWTYVAELNMECQADDLRVAFDVALHGVVPASTVWVQYHPGESENERERRKGEYARAHQSPTTMRKPFSPGGRAVAVRM